MALGNRQRPRVAGIDYTAAATVNPVSNASQPQLAPNATEILVGVDFWDHTTLDPSATWNDGASWDPATILYATPIRKVEIFALAGDDIYVGVDRDVKVSVGGYDLYAPGGGQLVLPIPGAQRLTFRVDAAGTAPTNRIEVYAYAGTYATL